MIVRFLTNLGVTLIALSSVATACSCIGRERPCQSLSADVVLVGRVIDTVPVKHPQEKDFYSLGYSMRLKVEESLKGGLGSEVSIETGSGGGDCGTPLPVGKRFFIFASKDKDGKLWTGMCMGNWALDEDSTDALRVGEYRKLIATHTGSIFGEIVSTKPVWRDDDIVDVHPKPMAGMTVHAQSGRFNTVTKTAEDGSYEFKGLPGGKYTIVPDKPSSLDFDHEYEDRYQAEVGDGSCARVSFQLQPTTRIRGHLSIPKSNNKLSLEVEAVPTSLEKVDQFSGKWDFIDEKGNFDLWPLPPGDYYVGVNINSSPKADAPFPPTYYPGVTERSAAQVIHIAEGETRNLDLVLHDFAKPRTVHFIAIGLDGKPLKAIYIQLEDLRHPGDAASYVNVDLDKNGAGTMTIYSGYSYHLHGSHWVSYLNDWCAKPVVIPSGKEPVEATFVMDRKAGNCEIDEMDGRKR